MISKRKYGRINQIVNLNNCLLFFHKLNNGVNTNFLYGFYTSWVFYRLWLDKKYRLWLIRKLS